MGFFKIKYFPANLDNYVYYFLSNLIFTIVLLSEIIFLFKYENKDNSDNILLFIPKIGKEFEEKKDLIFNQLSLNKDIISVNKKSEIYIKDKLEKILKNVELSDNIIPEVYEIQVSEKLPLDVNALNEKITSIIPGTIILELGIEIKSSIYLNFTIFFLTIFFIIFSNYFINKNFLYRLRDYLNLSRYFGVKDSQLIKNLNIGYLLLLTIIMFTTYIFYKHTLSLYFEPLLKELYFLDIFIKLGLVLILLNLTLFSIQLIYNIKHLNKL